MMTHRFAKHAPWASTALVVAGAVFAAPATYVIDPDHSYPSFEASHMGVSVWRGKFNKTTGKITLDKSAATGTVQVMVDVGSIDFGLDALNVEATKETMFDAAKYPQAVYKGVLADFKDGMPTRVMGDLTLHGVTRPLELKINSFKCIPHPMLKRELCGADASATFQRDAFGIDSGKEYGFSMDVTLRIQIEALQEAKSG